MDLESLTSHLAESLSPLFISKNVAFAILGGSWALNQQAWWSDVDVFISWPQVQCIEKNEQVKAIAGLALEVIETSQLENIQLSILEFLPINVQFHAINEGLFFFTPDPAIIPPFIERLLHEYYDYSIWFSNYLHESMHADVWRV
jgi:hypothetical protein